MQTTQDSITQVQKLVAEIGGLTENLDERIDGILRNYERQFLNAYRCHLNNLKEVLDTKD